MPNSPLDYPKLNELIKLKDNFIRKRNTPPCYVKGLKGFQIDRSRQIRRDFDGPAMGRIPPKS